MIYPIVVRRGFRFIDVFIVTLVGEGKINWTEAVLISIIHNYQTKKEVVGDGIVISDQKLADLCFLSVRQLRYLLSHLAKIGILTKTKKKNKRYLKVN